MAKMANLLATVCLELFLKTSTGEKTGFRS
jgi:hypothetical protein